jgi:DNA-binding CsgD family transcriptional regulator
VIRARRRLRNTRDQHQVFVNEDLTQRRAALAAATRQLKRNQKIADCWTYNGKIVIKTLANAIKIISTQAELNTFQWTRGLKPESRLWYLRPGTLSVIWTFIYYWHSDNTTVGQLLSIVVLFFNYYLFYRTNVELYCFPSYSYKYVITYVELILLVFIIGRTLL